MQELRAMQMAMKSNKIANQTLPEPSNYDASKQFNFVELKEKLKAKKVRIRLVLENDDLTDALNNLPRRLEVIADDRSSSFNIGVSAKNFWLNNPILANEILREFTNNSLQLFMATFQLVPVKTALGIDTFTVVAKNNETASAEVEL